MRISLLLFLLSTALLSEFSYASVTVYGTRIIYPAGKKYVMVQLNNNSDVSSLVQSWVDEGDIESTPETSAAPFIVTPPINKINANDGIQLRVHFLEEKLPQDRESVYYFNILDISPKSENHQTANRLQLVIQTRIKLFYRPQNLSVDAKNALNKVRFFASRDVLMADNPTPYFTTISNVFLNNKELMDGSIMIPPFSKKEIAINTTLLSGRDINIDYIGDNGDYIKIKQKVM